MVKDTFEHTAIQGQRQVWIDVYKGMAILLVVLGHLEISDGLYRCIYMFHMYAFFFIAGTTYVYRPNVRIGTYLWINIKRLYIPYVVYAFAWIITEIAINIYQGDTVDFSITSIARNIFSVLLGGGVFPSCVSVGPAWFLCALLSVRIIYTIAARMAKNNPYTMGAFAVFAFGLAYVLKGEDFLPFRLIQSLSAFLFFFLGYLCKGFNSRLSVWICDTRSVIVRVWTMLAAVVLSGALYWMSVLSDTHLLLVGNTLPANWIVTIIGGLSGCLMLVLLSMLASDVPVLSRLLSFCGRNSMIIMGIHSEIRMLALLVLRKMTGLSDEAAVVPVLILTIAASIPVSLIISKHFPILGGKKGGISIGN